jgi:hypothetical protein
MGVCFLCLSTSKYKYVSDGSFIDIRLSFFDSDEKLRSAFKDVMGQRNDDDRFRMLKTTNGLTRFSFIQCNNCPRGMPMFSLFCYQQIPNGAWLLRGYVPINDYHFTQNPGSNFWEQTLTASNDAEYTKVFFRNSIVFTITTNSVCLY